MESYDLVLAGGGAAGLSLAYGLAGPEFAHWRILLVEEASKTDNDRTWCYWEKGEGSWDHLLCMQWNEMRFFGPGGRQVPLHLSPYAYKMLRSGDFYAHVDAVLDRAPHIQRRRARITDFSQGPDGSIIVHLQQSPLAAGPPAAGPPAAGPPAAGPPAASLHVRASLVCTSIPLPGWQHAASAGLWLNQHFKGLYIKANQDVFEGQTATLMDFRVEQREGYPCFVYVLPTDHRHALVEYTVFSPQAWSSDAYDEPLQAYMAEILGLKPGDYRTEQVETGQIPMTDFGFADGWSRCYPGLPGLIPVGSMGGLGRPSTGYTFGAIQRHTQQMLEGFRRIQPADIQSNQANLRAQLLYSMPARFQVYDRTLLRVLVDKRYPGGTLFERLFARNSTPDLLAFLDGRSHLLQEWFVMNSTPRRIMARAMFR